ncbi:xanthine dehydrogenase small subunit [Nibrella saemangeumensis]|uniref:Xanthine dehydrogenase small subunit n=1 Tax=Nibrella saemangeumensis TaxID=1084526 RepID=A0ABP8N3D0_9BACT
MIRFLLNDRLIETQEPSGQVLLDFIRYSRHLTGTKTGCREGDCGACTVLVGDWHEGRLRYQSMTSCLMPLGNAHGKHIVTVEGLNLPNTLSPVQQAMVEEGGSQCGFCTVGFIVSLTGYALSTKPATYQNGITAIDGNICRCTGYKSIERAVARICRELAERPADQAMDWLVSHRFLPPYFAQIPERLLALQAQLPVEPAEHLNGHVPVPVGGGTDLFVQRPEVMRQTAIQHLFGKPALNSIHLADDLVHIGASCTADDLLHAPLLSQLFPRLPDYLKLVSSTPIRNMGTVGGNLINASPIGDLSIWLLALDAQVVLRTGTERRTLPLRKLYRGYKTLDKAPEEVLESIMFKAPGASAKFHFEKVSKRTHLDIASVNTAMLLETSGGIITLAHVSAGGVAPVPLYLSLTSAFLVGKALTADTIRKANEVAQTEITPISDVRGAAMYKRLLFRQLFYAHFLTLFTNQPDLHQLV